MNKSEKVWDKLAKNFDKRGMQFDQNYIRTIEKIKQYLNDSDFVLDYACGTGIITNEIAGNVKEIYAIDISSKMIDAAKRKANGIKIENIDFAKSTIYDERYEKESFDVILAINILHLLEDKQKVMQRLNELLKPGGLIISSTVCMGEEKTFYKTIILLATKIVGIPYMKFFKISELKDLIMDGKFQIVEINCLTRNPAHYFIVAKKAININGKLCLLTN